MKVEIDFQEMVNKNTTNKVLFIHYFKLNNKLYYLQKLEDDENYALSIVDEDGNKSKTFDFSKEMTKELYQKFQKNISEK